MAAGRDSGRVISVAAAAARLINFAVTLKPLDWNGAEPFRIPDSFPRQEPIACIGSIDLPAYLYYNSDFSRRLVFPRPMSELRSAGVKVVLVWDLPSWAMQAYEWKRVGGKLYELS